MTKLREVIYIAWIEPGRGVKPTKSGCSLHLTKEDSKFFAEDYMRLNDGEIVNFQPQESQQGYVSDSLYKKIVQAENGCRLTQFETDKLLASRELVLDLEERVA